ncbi:MAG: DUF1592 domain-containing protein [Myxococcota bacterium]|nr:DUF1592 domain-containing protein [Myxococcota bacterium]
MFWIFLSCSGDIPSEARLQRLSAEQYRNTVAVLFPDAELDYIHIPALERGRNFDNSAEMAGVSELQVELYHDISIDIVRQLQDQFLLPDCLPNCNNALIRFAERAWRRDLRDAEKEEIRDLFSSWYNEFGDDALPLGYQYILLAPDFLYLLQEASSENRQALGAWELASRLSYFLWNSAPDPELLDVARTGALLEEGTYTQQVSRMLDDPRAKKGIRSFHAQWLRLDGVGTKALDLKQYFSESDDEYLADVFHYIHLPQLSYEHLLLIDHTVYEEGGTLSDLLQTKNAYVTPYLAAVYGVEIPSDAFSQTVNMRYEVEGEWYTEGLLYSEITLPASQRSGILTRLAPMMLTSHGAYPSPVLRGLLVQEQLLCMEPTPPPTDVPPIEDADNLEGLSNRARFAAHTENPSCASCHKAIDGIGFTFEHYDSMGRYRAFDAGEPVDSTGELLGTDVDGSVLHAIELSEQLAKSQMVHDCFSRQLFRYAMGYHEGDAEEPVIESMSSLFWTEGGDIQELMRQLALSYTFRHRRGGE